MSIVLNMLSLSIYIVHYHSVHLKCVVVVANECHMYRRAQKVSACQVVINSY